MIGAGVVQRLPSPVFACGCDYLLTMLKEYVILKIR